MGFMDLPRIDDTRLSNAIAGTATKAALNATFVPKWKANTAYLAGDKVLSPDGDVVTAKVNFTSGASYSAANWNPSPAYARSTDASQALRPVAFRSNHYGNSTYLQPDGQTASTYRTQHVLIPGFSSTGLRLLYGNFALNPGPSPLTLRASLHWLGKSYQVTWGGVATVTIPSGAYAPLSDPLSLLLDSTLGAYSFWSETFVSVPAAGRWPLGLFLAPVNGEGSNIGAPGADLTQDGQYQNVGTTPSGGQMTGMYSPLAILGIPSKALTTFGLVTDSIGIGTGDGGTSYGSGDTLADDGFLIRALNRQYGYVWHAKFGDTAQFMADTLGYRARQLEYATHTFCSLGVNDIQSSRTAAQLAGDVIRHARHAATRRNPFFVATIPPRTTSTDLWATTVGQTAVANDAQRIVYNNWLRAGAPVDPSTRAYVTVGTSGALLIGQPGHPFTGYREIADTVESARDSGVFKAADRTVTDLVTTNTSATITSATAAFTAGDVGKTILIENGGGGSTTLIETIASVQSATSATLVGIAYSTGGSKRATINPWVIDGVHWSPRGHAAAAAVMDVPGMVAASTPSFG